MPTPTKRKAEQQVGFIVDEPPIKPGSMEHMLEKGDLVALCRPVPSTGTSTNPASVKRRRKDQRLRGVKLAYRHIDEGIRSRKKRQIAAVRSGKTFAVEYLTGSIGHDEKPTKAQRRKTRQVTWDSLTTSQQTDVLQCISDRLNSTRRAFRKQIRELYRAASNDVKRQLYELVDGEEIPEIETDAEEEALSIPRNIKIISKVSTGAALVFPASAWAQGEGKGRVWPRVISSEDDEEEAMPFTLKESPEGP